MIKYNVVGSYISELRKKNGMTQTELAENLNLTHQAVSKWENGITLPDTETLFALSQLFKVKIDDLLNGGIDKLKGDTYDITSEDSEDFDCKLGELCGIAPFVSRETLEKEFAKIMKITLGNLIGIAPFLSRETLDNAVDKIADDKIEIGLLAGLAPFISRDKLDSLFDRITE